MWWYKPDSGTVFVLSVIIIYMFCAALGWVTLDINGETVSNNIYVVIIGISGLLFLAVDILWDYIAYKKRGN